MPRGGRSLRRGAVALNFAHKRAPGQAKVRVFNPTVEEHGWQSTHTIIEIVNDDMPFLVDSAAMEVNRHGLTLHLMSHPIIGVTRDAGGVLTGLAKDGQRESFIHVEVDRSVGAKLLEGLAADIERVLGDVRRSFGDWAAMRKQIATIEQELEQRRRPFRLGSSKKAARSCNGWPKTTSRFSATGGTISWSSTATMH